MLPTRRGSFAFFKPAFFFEIESFFNVMIKKIMDVLATSGCQEPIRSALGNGENTLLHVSISQQDAYMVLEQEIKKAGTL
jgi:hypothetical protein